ncbi:hypothetical protein [Roseibacillus ishigakijimensis]|uniref:Cysteine-rich CPXCG n=1 Tax=Roseibacillus ishigakijimensis TaxID=454146 RepID=A0A934VLF3_9BACT|nr:hypothetical protein [Roseibacillus ishigakijimensis]MBK1833177.1 hypothetical protein [Roseibacillus ishigakijimensis]
MIYFFSTMDTESIQCPSCWEFFAVMAPPAEECPCEIDYDCEVCCRPLRILCNSPSEIHALGLEE